MKRKAGSRKMSISATSTPDEEPLDPLEAAYRRLLAIMSGDDEYIADPPLITPERRARPRRRSGS